MVRCQGPGRGVIGVGNRVTKRLRIYAVLMALIVVLSASPVILTTRASDADLNGAHWARTSNPFTLQVKANLTGKWRKHATRAARDWQKSGVVRVRVTNSNGGNRRVCQPRNGQVELCNAKFGENGWLGLARVWIDSNNHIVKASISMNDTYFNRAPYNKAKARQHTMCHELGHVLGLDHNGQKSCMNDSNRSVFRDAKPSKRDYNKLKQIYRHKDNKAAVRNTAREGARFGAASDPGGPSAADEGTFSATETVRTERLPGGGRLVTTVIWADE